MEVILVRQASEDGRLYGSVTAKNIVSEIAKMGGESITPDQIKMSRKYREIGVYPIVVELHPEVSTEITLRIERGES